MHAVWLNVKCHSDYMVSVASKIPREHKVGVGFVFPERNVEFICSKPGHGLHEYSCPMS